MNSSVETGVASMAQNSAIKSTIVLTTVMKQVVLMVGMAGVLLHGVVQEGLPEDAADGKAPPPSAH